MTPRHSFPGWIFLWTLLLPGSVLAGTAAPGISPAATPPALTNAAAAAPASEAPPRADAIAVRFAIANTPCATSR